MTEFSSASLGINKYWPFEHDPPQPCSQCCYPQIHVLVPLIYTLSSASIQALASPVLLHRLATPKHFPVRPQLPHPHMAPSALLSKQFTEPLTTTSCKPTLTVSCGIISCFLKSATICQSLPALGPSAGGLSREAALLHFSSHVDKTDCNTFLLVSSWSISGQTLSQSAAAALTAVVSPGSSLWNYKYFAHWQDGKSEHLGNWHSGKIELNSLYNVINFFWFASILFSTPPALLLSFPHRCQLRWQTPLCWCFALQPSFTCKGSFTWLYP